MLTLRLCSAHKALQAAARDAAQVCQAARPLSAALMGDVMAGLVAVALGRPADPCQVLRAGQAVGASGTQPGNVSVLRL